MSSLLVANWVLREGCQFAPKCSVGIIFINKLLDLYMSPISTLAYFYIGSAICGFLKCRYVPSFNFTMHMYMSAVIFYQWTHGSLVLDIWIKLFGCNCPVSLLLNGLKLSGVGFALHGNLSCFKLGLGQLY